MTTGLLLLKGYSQGSRICKKVFVDVLEMTSYVNLILFCLATFFSLKGDRDKIIAANISGIVAMVVIIVVLLYHIFTEITQHY